VERVDLTFSLDVGFGLFVHYRLLLQFMVLDSEWLCLAWLELLSIPALKIIDDLLL
jgi:hypothetical protein